MMHNTETQSGSTETTIGPLSIDGPQPAWMTLNDAREQCFTGEVVFEADPDVLAYLDHGVVYYAEVADGPGLGQRLLEAGLIDAQQLERGTVRVGDIEHLGRLFDRDPSIDRDAVLVMTEVLTEEVVMRLANDSIATVHVTAYRHHPSGLHRWFVAPVDAATAPRPVGAVSPLDTAVLDDLPGMGRSVDDLVDELTIEWDEPFDGADEIEVLPAVDDIEAEIVQEQLGDEELGEDVTFDLGVEPEAAEVTEVADDQPVVLDMAEYVDLDTNGTADPAGVVDRADDGPATSPPADAVEDDDELSLASDSATEERFDVIWPNGSVEAATDADHHADAELDETILEIDDESTDETDDPADVHFDLPGVTVAEDEDVATDDVDDDVAEAVRRALAAIETATVVEPAEDAPVVDTLGETAPTMPDADTAGVAAAELTTAPVPVQAFAPPTLETSAEAIYARATQQAETGAAPSLSDAGKASVVFVEEDDAAEASEPGDRSSALRRLIRSLGRKDH